MKGYEYIAQTIKGYGISHVFLMEVILRHTTKELNRIGVDVVVSHNEIAAGFMADGYARSTGKPGIAMCQSIGAGSMIAGVFDAHLGNSPVIALTGMKEPKLQYKNGFQEANHQQMFEGITKFNAVAFSSVQLGYLLRQSIREAMSGKPGPAHLDLMDRAATMTEMYEIDEPVYVDEVCMTYPPYRPSPDPEMVDMAVAALAKAERPLILAGRGAIVSGAHSEVIALAKKGDIPVVTTPDGKAIVDENDPLWAGIIGEYGMACANKTAAVADLVIFIGSNANDSTTHEWKCPPPQTKVIHIDLETSEIGRNYPFTIGLAGDAKVATALLVEKMAAKSHPEWREQVTGYLKANQEILEKKMDADNGMIQPARLIREINNVLPDNAIFVSDTGHECMFSTGVLRLKPSQNFYRCAGSLGWPYPASLGMKCGNPDRPVVSFIGDGGFLYYLGEMETAVRSGISTVTVVNNNSGLGLCAKGMNDLHADDPSRGIAYYGFNPVNYSEAAKAFGCEGVRVTDAAEIGPAVEKAIASGKPTIVEVITDLHATYYPFNAML